MLNEPTGKKPTQMKRTIVKLSSNLKAFAKINYCISWTQTNKQLRRQLVVSILKGFKWVKKSLFYHLGNCDDQCNANRLTVHSTCYLLQKKFGFDDNRKKWSTLVGIIWSCAVNVCPQYNPQPSFSGPKDQVCISFVIE